MSTSRRPHSASARLALCTLLGASMGVSASAAPRPTFQGELPSPSLGPSEAAPALQFEATDFKANSGETFRAEYGSLEVPERRDDPTSRKIRVAYVRFHSGRENPGPPLVFLAGGPGGPGIPTAENMVRGGGSRFFDLVGGDLIGIDQRGVGKSIPNLESDTKFGFDPAVPGEASARIETMTRVIREEAARVRNEGVDLAGYNTAESADDIDAIREALGYESMMLWGGSYGSHLGMSIVRRHGDHVARAMFVGPEGPDHTVKLPSYADDALAHLATLVDAYEPLNELVPDFMALVKEVLERYDEPCFAEVDGQKVGISRLDVEEVLIGALGYSPDEIKRIPSALLAMRSGDDSEIARDLLDSRKDDGIWSTMSYAMDAASGMSAERAKTIEAQSKTCLMGNAAAYSYAATSKAWGVPDLGDAFRAPLESDVPILFIVGDLDSRTPIANARELMQGLPNAKLVVVENAAHGVPMGLPKLRSTWSSFLLGKEVTVERITAPPIRFEVPSEGPEPLPEGAIEGEAADLAKCVGTYRFDSGMTMVITVEGARLGIEIPGKGTFALWPKDAVTYFCTDAPLPELTFVIGDGEAAASAVQGGGITAQRVE